MSSKNKRVLVTGVAGFLGSHLSEKLTQLGHSVVGIDNMGGGYKDNIPKNIVFHPWGCFQLHFGATKIYGVHWEPRKSVKPFNFNYFTKKQKIQTKLQDRWESEMESKRKTNCLKKLRQHQKNKGSKGLDS